ncbi:MAG: CoB--CoM heterodisulfide reductase iron-sulfur subunit B family protein, partial [Dehalococcoidia bacterium]
LSSAKEFDVSARLVCRKLGIDLRELEDWTCCGASAAHTIDELLSIVLPARNLQIAEQEGLPLATACAMCYSRLKIAAHELGDAAKLDQFKEIIGKDFHNTVKVVHLLEILDSEKMSFPVEKPLQDLKIACYYGCLLARPRDTVGFDDEENPHKMDKLMNALGAESVEWGFKTECCGASLPFSRPDVVIKLSHRILYHARQAGADCVAVACPMCHSNLDTRQSEMKAKYRDDFELPVLYFTQLLGLALGFLPHKLGLEKHFVDPRPILKSKELA